MFVELEQELDKKKLQQVEQELDRKKLQMAEQELDRVKQELDKKKVDQDLENRKEVHQNQQKQPVSELDALIARDRKEPRSCTPAQHILYLKTHKCASSSLQNIFFRYGYNNNLLFALPAKGHYLGNPYAFKSRMVPAAMRPPDGMLDIFALHSRLNVPEMSQILHPDTIYVTAVREPADLFESFYNYFNMPDVLGLSLSEFLSQPIEKQKATPRHFQRFGYNMMLYDLGVDITPHLTEATAREAVQFADQLFKLVLIAERLDEGLILMKELLCWDYKDIAVLTKNARRKDERPQISQADHLKLKQLNKEDFLLYEYFLEKHEKAVMEFGKEKMAQEVAKLQEYKRALFHDCKVQIVNSFGDRENGVKDDNIFKEYSYQVYNYVVDEDSATEECLLLVLPELKAVEVIRERTKQLLQERSVKRLL